MIPKLPAIPSIPTLPTIPVLAAAPILAGLAMTLGLWGLWCLFWYRKSAKAARERVRTGLKLERNDDDLLDRLRASIAELALTVDLEKRLARANIRIPVADFVLMLLAVALVLGFLIGRAFAVGFLPGLSMAIGLVFIGTRVFLKQRGASLAQEVTAQLGDAVRLLAGSLRAGLSLWQGLALLAREVPAPLGPMIQRAVHEMQLGASLEEALDQLVDRVDSADLRFVVTTILLQHELGGDLAGALDSVAAALSERLMVEGEVRTLTAEQRYVAMVLPVIPVLGVIILNAGHPGYIRVLTRPLGILLLAISLTLQVLGFWLINRTAKIKV